MTGSSSSTENLKKHYFGLSKTIRRILLSGIFAAIYAVLDMAFIQPLMEEYSEITTSIQQAKAQSKGFAAQLLNIQGTAGIDPSLSDKQQLEIATLKLSELESDINLASEHFVSPQKMSEFLNELLQQSNNLTLISMVNQTPDAILVKTTREIPGTPEPTKRGKKQALPEPTTEIIGEDKVYKHRVQLTMRGKYSDIARYIKEMETLPWHLFWQSLDLKTEKYPYSEITLEIYTLSLYEDWLTL